MTATAVDLRDPAAVATELGEANRRLAGARSTPAAVVGMVQDVCDAIALEDDHPLALVNPWVWIRIQGAALRASAALRDDEPDRRRRLRLALEQMRFLFARLAERAPIGEDRPAGEVAQWLEATLPSVAQQRKAALLGVGLRTYQRWIAATTSPSGADERRLRVVARIVNQLRHSLTGPGVVEWFEFARADLGGASPADVLDDPERLEPLLAAAAASRGNVAA
jgi:hypothetical protein